MYSVMYVRVCTYYKLSKKNNGKALGLFTFKIRKCGKTTDEDVEGTPIDFNYVMFLNYNTYTYIYEYKVLIIISCT